MDKRKQRLLAAATVSACLISHTGPALAVEQSARDFLANLASNISTGQADTAQADLAKFVGLCTSEVGIQVGSSIINLEQLNTLIAQNPSQAVSAIRSILAVPALIRFFCGDLKVVDLDMDEGFPFPTGSAG